VQLIKKPGVSRQAHRPGDVVQLAGWRRDESRCATAVRGADRGRRTKKEGMVVEEEGAPQEQAQGGSGDGQRSLKRQSKVNSE
jgi:hypothetical protein